MTLLVNLHLVAHYEAALPHEAVMSITYQEINCKDRPVCSTERKVTFLPESKWRLLSGHFRTYQTQLVWFGYNVRLSSPFITDTVLKS